MNPYDIPVLVLAFNRPQKLAILLDSLKELGCRRLFFAVDGPREGRPEDVQAVREVYSVIRSKFAPAEDQTLFQSKNLGLRFGPPAGISWFFDQVEEGVILEDDCIPGDSFLPFVAWSLDRYRHVETVKLISGFNRFDQMKWGESFRFIKTAMIWGWASWRRAWKQYDPLFLHWDEPGARRALKQWSGRFPVFDFWRESIELVRSGRATTWDVAWCWTVYYHQGLAIMPRVSLIRNIGFGPDSTNTTSDESGDERFGIAPRSLVEPYVAPKTLSPDREFQQKLNRKEFWRTDDTVPGRLKRFLKAMR